ncbi:MAG: hypothetical protein MUF87_18180 [Anaerolineae bacterium]|nr:hypothetical protein [Anaerolineae bacterium]
MDSQQTNDTGHLLIVGVSASPNNERLLHAAARLAEQMRVGWIAVHIRDHTLTNSDEQRRIDEHLAVARDLGAQLQVIEHHSTAEALVAVALEHPQARIVLGRSHPGGIFGRVRSLADQIMDLNDRIDIFILNR